VCDDRSDLLSAREDVGMNVVKVVLATIGLILVGMIAWALIKLVFGFVFQLFLGALLVGGCWYLYTKAKRSGRIRR
jgi:hypothetical protein